MNLRGWVAVVAATAMVGAMAIAVNARPGANQRPLAIAAPAAPQHELVTPPPTAVPGTDSFSARFALQNGQTVLLDYVDARNYRFSANAGQIQTFVLDGHIFLHVTADGAQAAQTYWYGNLAEPPPMHPLVGTMPSLSPTTVPAAGVAAWGKIGRVFDVSIANSGPFGTQMDATVARSAKLAAAQLSIVTMLLPAMDMALCGDGVQALTSWWPTTLTGTGYAVVATSAGVRLDGPMGKAGAIALPTTAPVVVHPLARLAQTG